ncbi:MAG: HAMP domain-containing protein [Deltaproteobacteria bacterium]|nr:HAMP domain-containing protein [Deltaproteobacteria bacterium]MBW1747073.1 HAMP domain-containing protein [Deltaproteobacteria bacterium]MBW1969016.1 HAMP domain-containing protein [Deltaproteobacteria bacterium]MBW2155253.1 HAMP domain-containing protein [Deltaproteobacteria bacterium]MBW2197252.1 HAMP domain-containing protein [Deltaproteobacteria bacterium]
MSNNRYKKLASYISKEERNRRKREVIISVVIIAVIALLTFAENRIMHFGAGIPVSNTILMFILININLLLLILLIFLVFRNLVKLLYDRKRKVMGAKLRTKLVVAFITLSLLPTIVLFFFSINFITTSIEFWFNVPVEQALENSLRVGRSLYWHAEETSSFFMERMSYQIEAKKLLDPKNKKALFRYIQIVQREFNLNAVEIYTANADRLTFALAPGLEDKPFAVISSDDLKKNIPLNSVRTVSERISSGELIRTIGTIPFGVAPPAAEAFVALANLMPPDLAENMASISRGYEEYQQIKLLKKPIQITYYITLSIVALLVVFCAVWFGFYLAKTITIPIRELAEGTRKVAEGDLSFSIEMVADDEIGSLVNSFNKMTKDLRIGRDQLELSARLLRDQNVEIEKRRQYMEIVLKNVSAGVITLDAGGFISTMNKSAEKMLNLKSEDIIKKSYKKILSGEMLDLAEEVMEQLKTSRNDAVRLPLKLAIDGRPMSFLMHINALKDDMGQHMGIVMVFDDLTELEKAQRMAAWREVARRIAHEVKNPLTPISLSAQRLKRKYSDQINQPVFDECTQTITDHVELIRNLVDEFSLFARFPTANPKPCNLPPIIEETLALYKEGHKKINFNFNITEDIPRLNLDRQQIKQAMINLVDNAIGSIRNEGNILIILTHDPILKIVRLEVADDGVGISDIDKTRLFEPYFSTKKAGMGLGLTIVSSIITDHNGMIRVQDNKPKGAKFVIDLPV